jgi:hypothetical protein
MPWEPRVDRRAQPQYAQNNVCKLWPSYEGQNDWRISKLVPKTTEDERDVWELMNSNLITMEARITLMIQEGKIGAVTTTDEAAMGYYVMKWLTESYSLQEDMEGMSGVISTGVMVANALFYNRVTRAPFWYTQSGETMVVEVRYVLLTGLEMEEVSATNTLPQACNKVEAKWRKATRVSLFDHEAIMEEAERRNWLEYDNDDEEKSNED